MEKLSKDFIQEKSCVFFGSSDHIAICPRQVKTVLRTLIVDFDVTEFITTGNNGSEKQLEEIILELKNEFEQVRITFLSVYERNTTENLSILSNRYDGIMFPPELEKTRKTNTPTVVSYWAAKQSDFIFVHSVNNYAISRKVANKFSAKCLFDFGTPPRRWKSHLEKKLSKVEKVV